MRNTMNGIYKIALIPFFSLTISGCAFESDVTDLHLEMDQLKDKIAQLNLKLDANERVLKDRSSMTTKEQGEAFLKLDQMGVDLQTIQGRLDENNHILSDLSQKTEEHALQITDLNSRLGALGNRIDQLEKSAQPSGNSPTPDQGKLVLPGKSPGSINSSSLSPQDAYNLAYNDFVKGNYDLAVTEFQNFTQQFPSSVLMPNALYWLGESYFGKKDYSKAIEYFDRVSREYSKHDKAPTSILKEGYAYFEMGEKLRGKSYLKKVIEQYPRSSEANLAKEKLSTLR